MKLKARIKKFLEETGMSQKEFGLLCGSQYPQQISAWLIEPESSKQMSQRAAEVYLMLTEMGDKPIHFNTAMAKRVNELEEDIANMQEERKRLLSYMAKSNSVLE